MTWQRRWGVILVTLGWVTAAWAQDAATAQKKLLSKRAAEADAYRKIAECIKGLQITSDTYVRDFVAESDSIRASMDSFIRGVKLGQPKWYDDLSCEVPGEVTVAKVIQEIKTIHERHYKGNRITGKDIEEMKQYVKTDVIRVVGMGAPREDLPRDLPEGVVEQLGGPPIPPEPPIPDLWKKVGTQGRLLAIRAAEVDAKRKLLERIVGLRITSDTTVRDFVAEYDEIKATAMGSLVGAKIVRVFLHHDEPIAEVTVEVPLESVVSTIKAIHSRSIQGDRIKGSDIEEVTRSIKTQTFEATGMGVPRPDIIKAYNAKIEQDRQIPNWAMAPISMTGSGVPPQDKSGTPQGKLLAARSAELDAKRKLGEHIAGLKITSNTVVKDFVAEHDDIRTHMDAILVGSQVEKTEFESDGVARVTVSIPGMRVWEVLYERIRVIGK